MTDPLMGGALKAAISAVLPLWKAGAREMARRNADDADFASLTPEIDEALDVLAQASKRPDKAVLERIKAILSDRPTIFDSPGIRTWLLQPATRQHIQEAAHRLLLQSEVGPARDHATQSFIEQIGGDLEAAAVAFEYAVAFVLVSISRDMSVGERLIVHKLDAIDAAITGAARAAPSLPQELVDAHVSEAVDRLRKLRSFPRISVAAPASQLLADVLAGSLSSASPQVRAYAIAWCVRLLSASGDLVQLRAALGVASGLQPLPETLIAEAFLVARSDWREALSLLAKMNSPPARDAALRIYCRAHDETASAAWLDSTGWTFDNFDAEGCLRLLPTLIGAGRWDQAIEWCRRLQAADFEHSPALHPLAGLLFAAAAAPNEFRAGLAAGAQWQRPAYFPLAETRQALADRRVAAAHYRAASNWTVSSGADAAALTPVFTSMALWLESRDPSTAGAAKAEIAVLLDDEALAVAILPLALGLGLPVDTDKVERALDRLQAINPKGDANLAFARLTLARQKGDPGMTADYLARHRELLRAQLNVAGVTEVEIDVLLEAGRSERAREVLAEVAQDLPDDVVARLEDKIGAGASAASLERLAADYAAEPGLSTMGRLIEGLSRQGYSDRLFELWSSFVVQTKVVSEAEQLLQFLVRHERRAEIGKVLDAISDLVDASTALRSYRAWEHFRAGRFREARAELDALKLERDDPNDRALDVNLIVFSGRWPELATFIESEWAKKDGRSSQELLGAAELAARIRSPRLGGLLEAATERSPEDADVLIACYGLATRYGLEDMANSHEWLQRAIAHSGEHGPVRQVDIQELIESRGPEWQAQIDSTWDKLRAGEIPMGAAAKVLHRTTLELQLAPMVVNQDEPDPRKRIFVPAFSGARRPSAPVAGRLGLDATAIVTLGVLGLLKPVIERGGVHIGHPTLKDFFEEREKLGFHQASRVRFAHDLSRSLAKGHLFSFSPTAHPDPTLAGRIGPTLAAMIAQASTPADRPRFVIRSAPVHKIGSFSGEAVDLSAHQSVLRSCQAVIDKLAERGRLTSDEEAAARAYLASQREERWGDEEPLSDQADLYLDDLSVAYLESAGVLRRLHEIGLRAFVSARETEEANALIEIDRRAEGIGEIIEAIRLDLQAGIERGEVQVCPEVADGLPRVPFVDTLLGLWGRVDVLVTDDRYFNKSSAIASDGVATPTRTSLDLIDWLVSEGRLNQADRRRLRTKLRQCGAGLIPVEVEELVQELARTKLRDDRVLETAELRAIRENMAVTLMRRWVQPAQEVEWVADAMRSFGDAVRPLWAEQLSPDEARARSRWLLEAVDLRTVMDIGMDEDGSRAAALGPVGQLLRLMISPEHLDKEGTNEAFTAWLEEEALQLKHEDAQSYRWLVGRLREIVFQADLGDEDG